MTKNTEGSVPQNAEEAAFGILFRVASSYLEILGGADKATFATMCDGLLENILPQRPQPRSLAEMWQTFTNDDGLRDRAVDASIDFLSASGYDAEDKDAAIDHFDEHVHLSIFETIFALGWMQGQAQPSGIAAIFAAGEAQAAGWNDDLPD